MTVESGVQARTRSWGRVALLLVAAVVAAALAAGIAFFGFIDGWGRAPIAPRGDTKAFLAAAIKKIDSESRGNAAFVLIEGGKPVGAHFVSKGRPVNGDSLFQVASLSKWITAWGVMKLVEQGKLDLDTPVSKYLTRWSLPPSQFDNNGVTVRRLLSHTAGLTDGLGYAGFAPGKPMQSLEASLTRAADASPGRDGRVRVGLAPGSTWKYSGGGYTLLQLLIEEVSGRPFNDYMREEILIPLGMTHSTFVLDDKSAPDVAEFYDLDGGPATHFRFTALAAASLYTSTSDLTRFLDAHLRGPNGAPEGRGVLKPETLRLMRTPQASQLGIDIWGLGLVLYAPGAQGGYVIGHDGNNAPAINTAERADPGTGDGIIVLETGTELLATRLGGDWVLWHTGSVDLFTVQMEMKLLLAVILTAALVAFLLVLIAGWRWTRRPASG